MHIYVFTWRVNITCHRLSLSYKRVWLKLTKKTSLNDDAQWWKTIECSSGHSTIRSALRGVYILYILKHNKQINCRLRWCVRRKIMYRVRAARPTGAFHLIFFSLQSSRLGRAGIGYKYERWEHENGDNENTYSLNRAICVQTIDTIE
jgi:hypothetical protein